MRATLTFVFTSLLCFQGFAQDKLNTIQRAMRDEMERNLKELKTDGFEKPFFINYTIQDVTYFQVRATLGALTKSQETKSRDALSIRMLVGDYEFNDESIDNNLFSPPQSNAISLPLDDDYLGIRRSLWVSTDNVYRSASRQFAKNKEMVKEQGKPLAELPHRTFAKVTPSKIDIEGPAVKFDKAATEEFARKVSLVFNEFKEVEGSSVEVAYWSGYRYLVNSEGSINRIPVNYMKLGVLCRLRAPNGEYMMDTFFRYSLIGELPSIENTMEDARNLARKLIKETTLPALEEDYSGPVLFEGREAASQLYIGLFNTENSLYSTNDIPKLKGAIVPAFGPNFSTEAKIGKQLFAKSMTVKAVPKLKKFGDVNLMGSFEVDREGTIPADETVLVENGVLKQQCNDRTLTKADQVANGLSDGTGVCMISFDNGTALAEMKAKLIEQAKKEGLDYGLRVTSGAHLTFMATVYKVYVSDGREEQVGKVNLANQTVRSFKKILETSKEMTGFNLGAGDEIYSIICPQAVLFEEMEMNVQQNQLQDKEADYVPSPLKK